jgi:hypothetical protein
MMLLTLVLLNAVIFTLLSSIHFYWLMGGKWGVAFSLPSNPSTSTQDFLFKPSIVATFVVAIGLLLFAIITLGNVVSLPFGINQYYFRYGDMLISIIFLLRAIGDFKYVGFFKQIRETSFAKMDTKLYAPLCLFIAGIGFLIFVLTPLAL